MRTSWVLLAFVAGVAALPWQAALPPPAAYGAGLALLTLTAAVARAKISRPTGAAITVVAAFAAGFLWAGARAEQRLADWLPAALEGRDLQVTGVVASLPREFERGVRFDFDVESAAGGEPLPRRVALAWYEEAGDGAPAVAPVAAGERWRLAVRLKRPHGNANPHGFDYEAWLLERGIGATGYVRPGNGVERLAAAPARFTDRIVAERAAIRERMLRVLAGEPYAGVLAALAVGDQAAIPPAQWQVFTRTGVNHLMSISGLHVTMVAGLALAAVGALWRRVPALVLRVAARRAAVLAGVAAALAYALLAGFAVPAQRTLYMLAVVAAALWLDRAQSPVRVLAAAAAFVVLIDPWAVMAPGFWLSFGAVATIFYVTAARVAAPGKLRLWGRIQWAVTLALAPLLIAMFQQVSIVSFAANAVAIPLVSLVVVPLTLLAAVVPVDGLLVAAHAAMAACMAILEPLAGMPAAVWQQHAPAWWALALALAGIAWLLAPAGFPNRWAGALLALPLFFAAPPRPQPGELWVDILDVGQGLAVVVRTEHRTLVYDTGASFGLDADSGARVVVPHLRGEGAGRVDLLVVSHDDNDHAGGARSLLAAVPVAGMLSSLDAEHSARSADVPHQRCESGQRWTWDGVAFAVLGPDAAGHDDPRRSANSRSCVLHIAAPGGAVLLPGDIGRRDEAALVVRSGAALAADVLVAPHHGSGSSSSPGFVAAARPRFVVFTAGYRNPFGHPRADVAARYAAAGVQSFRSDRDGAVRIRLRPNPGIEVNAWRAERPRYWYTIGDGAATPPAAPAEDASAPTAR
ncbi:MAG: DNA internalization-related competence protein ComEC/Rec2 [Pseudomonadota bacterium]